MMMTMMMMMYLEAGGDIIRRRLLTAQRTNIDHGRRWCWVLGCRIYFRPLLWRLARHYAVDRRLIVVDNKKVDYLMYRRYRRSRTVVNCPLGIYGAATCLTRLVVRSAGIRRNGKQHRKLGVDWRKISREFARRGRRQRISCYFRCWNTSHVIQFKSNCPTLTPKVTSGKRLSQCRERVFRQKRFQFTLENVSLLFSGFHGAGCSKLYRPSIQPSCQWFITVSPGRSERRILPFSKRYLW